MERIYQQHATTNPCATGDDKALRRRAETVAHLVPLVVLPSGIWRTLLGFGVPMGFDRATLDQQGFPGRGTAMVVGLTVLTECLALLTFGLVRAWGEMVPDWVPMLAGRGIPPGPIVAVATAGGVVLTAMWVFAMWGVFTGELAEISGVGWRLLVIVCYLPALAWGPLLLWATALYHRRRRRRRLRSRRLHETA